MYKAAQPICGGVLRVNAAEFSGSEGGAREYAPAEHVLDPEPGSRDNAGAIWRLSAVIHPRWEPYAGKPHVRICGACDETHVPIRYGVATSSRCLVSRQRGRRRAQQPALPVIGFSLSQVV